MATVKISGRKIIRHDPDVTFKHHDAYQPSVAIQVSYSQNPKDIPRLADDYILETDGSVRVVVGLDINFKIKKGTISMQRPNNTTNEQGQSELQVAETLSARITSLNAMMHAKKGEVFRDEFGAPNLSPDAGLKLELKDFAPEILADGTSDFFALINWSISR